MGKPGVEVKVIRIRKGITQKELAKKVGISRTAMNRLERGKCNSINLFKRVADALEVDYHEII